VGALDSVTLSRGMCVYRERERDRGVVGSARFCHLIARYVYIERERGRKSIYIYRERERER
jgi:hypothetical protein